MSRTPTERLEDIIERVTRATAAEAQLDAAEALRDETAAATAFDAILYDLLVIGEAIKSLPAELTNDHPEVEWTLAARLRDILAHQYFRVDSAVVRATLDEPLTLLRNTCIALVEHDRGARVDGL